MRDGKRKRYAPRDMERGYIVNPHKPGVRPEPKRKARPLAVRVRVDVEGHDDLIDAMREYEAARVRLVEAAERLNLTLNI